MDRTMIMIHTMVATTCRNTTSMVTMEDMMVKEVRMDMETTMGIIKGMAATFCERDTDRN